MCEFESETKICPICTKNKCIEGDDWCFNCRFDFYTEQEQEEE